MRLCIAQHLQTILQPAQEAIRLGQCAPVVRIDLACVHQRLQGRQQATLAQARLASAANQLQRLRQELDLANAARPALDVVQAIVPGDFGSDRRLHLAQAVQRGEVQVTPVDEGA